LNERFGTDFSEDDQVFVRELEERLAGDQALAASVRTNLPENARLTFDYVVSDRLQDMVDTNFEFYKRVTDDQEFARFFLDWLFERFRKSLE
jgi:type I restriction enzyme R subunit